MRNKNLGSNKLITLCYCGADMPWEELQSYGFCRRNTYLLKGFIEHPDIIRTLIFHPVPRESVLPKILRICHKHRKGSEKNSDVYVATIVPERKWLPGSKLINHLLYKLQIWLQVGNLNSNQNVVWCYWPNGFKLAKRLNLPGLWVFDADHNIIDDINQDKFSQTEREHLLLDCAERTQLIVAGARSMLKWFKERGISHVAYLRNGVDLARFNSLKDIPTDITHIAKPLIGYLGTLSRWVDYSLLINLAKRRPDWNFVVIGQPYKEMPTYQFEDRPNVIFIGKRSADKVPAYLSAFDVGVALYKTEFSAWCDGDSMKIYEYLAAGIPVVTTPFHAHLDEDFVDLLQIARDVDEFEKSIEFLLAWDDERRSQWDKDRLHFLKANTWDNRTQEAINLIQNLTP